MTHRKLNGLQGNGNGPWLIDPTCEGVTHNSARAARGIKGNSSVRLRCICPHGQDLLAAALIAARERERTRLHPSPRRVHDPRVRLQPPAPAPVERRSPNFVTGRCTSPSGMLAADRGMNDQASLSGIKDREIAKSYCESCPMLQECKAWVIAEEKPAGSWGGVWGGMDPWNRKGLELIITGGHAEVIPYVHA